MRGKNGISAIVATVLIILITVGAVTILWSAVIPMIRDNLEFSQLEGRVSILTARGYTTYDEITDVATVQVKREADDGVMDKIRIMFYFEGESIGTPVTAPESGGTKTYSFDIAGLGKPDSVSVIPIFKIGQKEKEGDIGPKTKILDGTFNGVVDDVLGLGEEHTGGISGGDIINDGNLLINVGVISVQTPEVSTITGDVLAAESGGRIIEYKIGLDWSGNGMTKYTPSSSSDMVNFVNTLEALPLGSRVIIATNGGLLNFNEDVKSVLVNYGASFANLNRIESNGLYILIGEKGYGEGNCYVEKVGASTDSSISYSNI